jgi:hypothetical protein
MSPGDRMIWLAVVSNYGHLYRIPVRVLSVGARRVRVETEYQDGRPERRINVGAWNLRPRTAEDDKREAQVPKRPPEVGVTSPPQDQNPT